MTNIKIGPKRPVVDRKLSGTPIKITASSIITRISLFQKIWANLPELIQQQFAPEGNIPLKVLMVNFKGIPSLETALRKHENSRVFPEDRLWLDQLDLLKQALSANPQAMLAYENLQGLNKNVQEQALKNLKNK